MSRAHSYSHSRAHSPTFPSLHLRHSSFSNLSITSPTSLLILQPFRRFTYVTAHSPTLPLLYLRHSSFSNPFFASPTSQALHLIHLVSRPWFNIQLHFPPQHCWFPTVFEASRTRTSYWVLIIVLTRTTPPEMRILL